MTFVLGSKNVFDYLITQGICEPQQYPSQIEYKSSRNFNLLVSFTDNSHFLIKQEPHDVQGKTLGQFLKEWRIHELLEKYPELSHLRSMITEAIHYDSSCSIIVFKYLKDYCNLAEFYTRAKIFPTEIAVATGSILAAVHRATIDCQNYEEFFAGEDIPVDKNPNFFYGLEPIKPEIFGALSADGLKFFELYQRYDSLRQAIAELNTAFESCCLTHNDLKLENIIVPIDWEQARSKANPSANSVVRLIDWENSTWGDPALDLGMMLASYLRIWLNSLDVGTDIDVETALRLATTPLDALQPSIATLTKAYFENFPEIVERRPDFLLRVVQFTGLALIKKIRIKLQYQQPFGYPEPFGNKGMCMLQVAKTLLCAPKQSIPVIFGATASELNCLGRLPA